MDNPKSDGHLTTKTTNLPALFKNQSFFLLIVIILLSVIFGSMNPRFLTWGNLLAVFQQITVLGIATMAMALLLISGGIDLSIGSMIGLSSVVICTLIMRGSNVGLAILIGFGIPVICGFINGVIVSKSKCVPLIVTLGMNYVYYGLALVISQGLFLSMKGNFQFLGRGRVFGVPMPMIIVICNGFCHPFFTHLYQIWSAFSGDGGQ